jgi:microcystin-dependent protein
MTLDLSAYKPIDNTITDADAMSAAFTTLETWGNALPTTTIPSGAMLDFGGTSSPSGWFMCDGSAISRTTYSALFAAIGTAYGTGDGSTTFNLPDYRGRVSVGYAASGGHADVSAVGNNDGASLSSRRPKHKHTTTAVTATSSTGAGGGIQGGTAFPAATVGPQTGAEPTDTPSYLVSNKIIKA